MKKDRLSTGGDEQRSGAALGMVLVVMLMFSLLGLGLLKQGEANAVEMVKQRQSIQTFWAAEGAIEQAIAMLVNDSNYRSSPTPFSGELANVYYNVDVVETNSSGNTIYYDITAVATSTVWRRTVETQVELIVAGSSSSSQPVAMYSEGNTPRYHEWSGTTFGAPNIGVNMSDRWRVMQGASASTRDEKIVVGIESGGEVSGQRWDGTGWDSSDLVGLGAVNETFWWSAEVDYESQSGDALLVWCDGALLRYKTWNGTTWSATQSILAYAGATPRQLVLASCPIRDEMILVVSDSNSHDFALVWDGTNWGNVITLDTGSGDDRTDIYAAYESLSGEGLVLYGSNNKNLRYQRWEGGVWSGQSSTASPSGIIGNVRWVTLASDPNSDRIAMGVTTFLEEVWYAVWNGGGWQDRVAYTGPLSPVNSSYPGVAVAFESQSGEALATFSLSVSSFYYETWSPGGGWSGPAIGVNLNDRPNSMMLDPDPLSNQIMLSVQDNSKDLHYIPWDNGWGADNELSINTGETKNQPFVFLWAGSGCMDCVTVRDEFNTIAYNNNDGSVDWSSVWVEVDDDTSPNSGDVYVDPSGVLYMSNYSGGAMPMVHRNVNLTGVDTATWSFDVLGNGSGLVDALVAGVSDDGGMTWTYIAKIDGQVSGSYSYPLEDHMALNNTITIGLFVYAGFQTSPEYAGIDNIQVEFPPGTALATITEWQEQ